MEDVYILSINTSHRTVLLNNFPPVGHTNTALNGTPFYEYPMPTGNAINGTNLPFVWLMGEKIILGFDDYFRSLFCFLTKDFFQSWNILNINIKFFHDSSLCNSTFIVWKVFRKRRIYINILILYHILMGAARKIWRNTFYSCWWVTIQ